MLGNTGEQTGRKRSAVESAPGRRVVASAGARDRDRRRDHDDDRRQDAAECPQTPTRPGRGARLCLLRETSFPRGGFAALACTHQAPPQDRGRRIETALLARADHNHRYYYMASYVVASRFGTAGFDTDESPGSAGREGPRPSSQMLPTGSRLLSDPEGIEPPLAGYASKLLRTAVIELELRPDDEVFDGTRDEHLTSTRDRADARADVDSDPVDVIFEYLALSGVQPAAAPNSATRSMPTASSTASRSSICCSRVPGRSSGSDSPVPRRSKITTRANDASRSRPPTKTGSSHCRSRCEATPPIFAISSGPSPITTARWGSVLSRMASLYRVGRRSFRVRRGRLAPFGC